MLIASAKSPSVREAFHQLAVSHCVPGFTEVGGCCYCRKWVSSSWKIGGRLVRWKGGKDGRVMRWQGGKGRRVVRWEGGRFLVLFKSGEYRVSPRFYLSVSDVNQGNEGVV